MQIIRTIDELQPFKHGACVLTMGALHAGHRALLHRAVTESDVNTPVIATIFVNPTQFNEADDLAQYPRPLEDDIALAAAVGIAALFIPAPALVYPEGPDSIPVPPLPPVATQPGLEDAFRPNHFPGVCQVVQRFFNLLQPARGYFGEKDYQQLLVIRALTKIQALPIEIVGCPTVREADGLARSSRNINLTSSERTQALGISKALRAINQNQAPLTIADTEAQMRRILKQHDIKIDYAVIRNAETLRPIENTPDWRNNPNACRALIAGSVGQTRLIDNRAVQPLVAGNNCSAI